MVLPSIPRPDPPVPGPGAHTLVTEPKLPAAAVPDVAVAEAVEALLGCAGRVLFDLVQPAPSAATSRAVTAKAARRCGWPPDIAGPFFEGDLGFDCVAT